jgi:hypothetical protein
MGRRRSYRGIRLGAALKGRRPRVWGEQSGRRGFHSGAHGVHPRRQHSREGAAMAGVGHGAALASPLVTP